MQKRAGPETFLNVPEQSRPWLWPGPLPKGNLRAVVEVIAEATNFGMKPYEWMARPDGRIAALPSAVPGGRDARIDTQQVNTIHYSPLICT